VLYGRQVLGQPQALRAQRRLKDGRWSSPVTVARDGYRPSLSVDASGSAVTVFATSTDRVAAARKPAGKRWKRSRAISPKGVEIVDFDVTVRNGGTALVAIGRASGRVDLVQRPPRGTWSVPQRVAAAGSTVYDVLVAAGPAGDTFVGWGGYALFGKYRADEGSWSRRYTISPDAGSDVLEAMYAGVAPDGDVVVLWEQEARPLKVRTMGREDPAGD
jgi:hypothetical protein